MYASLSSEVTKAKINVCQGYMLDSKKYRDVCAAFLNFLKGGTFLPSINHTFIALIPKFSMPTSNNEFRPINLC